MRSPSLSNPGVAPFAARELFGAHRGDLKDADALPKLAAALGIPKRPDPEMILSFLADVGAAPTTEAELTIVLDRCIDRLADRVNRGQPLRVPQGAAVSCAWRGSVRIARMGDPRLRAGALAPGIVASFTNP